MMAQKPLRELLQEDQEPFLLKNYMADRRFQLKKSKPIASKSETHLLQIKKRKPISQSSNFPRNFCRNACLFSINNNSSPDLIKKSPVFDFHSPVKSPCKSSNAIFLHIPAKTAALLLEAALRIQKQSSSSQKSKNSNGFGLFGSLIKRRTGRSNKTRKRELTDGAEASVKDILKWDYSTKQYSETGFYRSRNDEEKKSWDLDLQTSISGQLSEEEEMELVNKLIDASDDPFCESPFRFVLERSPSSASSSGHRTPVFLSPATSPCRHKPEGKGNKEEESLKKFEENNEEEENDKEQCSPVSVLDPPFEDDDDGHDDHSQDDGFDLQCSFAIVHRTKQQLLRKLRRFEKLAELDPVELEKRILKQEQESDDDNDSVDEFEKEESEWNSDGKTGEPARDHQNIGNFIIEELKKPGSCHLPKIPNDMKRLISDIINEEEEQQEHKHFQPDRETTLKRVSKRFESWKEVESITIDMMIGEDFKKEHDRRWLKYEEQAEEAALEIELGIVRSLLEELSQELIGFNLGLKEVH